VQMWRASPGCKADAYWGMWACERWGRISGIWACVRDGPKIWMQWPGSSITKWKRCKSSILFWRHPRPCNTGQNPTFLDACLGNRMSSSLQGVGAGAPPAD